MFADFLVWFESSVWFTVTSFVGLVWWLGLAVNRSFCVWFAFVFLISSGGFCLVMFVFVAL